MNYLFNLLFYLKNLIVKNKYTPKEFRRFICFMCYEPHLFPLTSRDYKVCDECFATLGTE